MQFITFAIAAMSIGSAIAHNSSVMAAASDAAMVTVHVVSVSNSNGSLTYSPDNLVAAKGDMVQFQFFPANHTVTQSTFDEPCQPISEVSNVTGIYSGFMPVKAADTTIPTYTILINSTTPMWLYCSQASHCQKGMVMVINENTKANKTRSLANFKIGAAAAAKNLAPSSGSTEGTSGSTSASSAGSSSSSGTSSSPDSSSSSSSSSPDSSSSAPDNSTSTSSSSSADKTGASAAVAMQPSYALGLAAMVALAFGLLA